MINRLFVYGTLAPRRQNEHLLKQLQGQWQKAYVRGKLYPEGWGAALGYPGLRLDEKGAQIEGFLFTAPTLPDYWSSLDAFEGEAYERVLTKVSLQDHSTVEAFVYALRETPKPI